MIAAVCAIFLTFAALQYEAYIHRRQVKKISYTVEEKCNRFLEEVKKEHYKNKKEEFERDAADFIMTFAELEFTIAEIEEAHDLENF